MGLFLQTGQGVLLVIKSDFFLSYQTGLSYFNPSYDHFLNLTEKFWSLNLTKYLLYLNLTKQWVFDKVNNSPKVFIVANLTVEPFTCNTRVVGAAALFEAVGH